MATISRKYGNDAAFLDGGWGAQVGRDAMWQQLEDGYAEGPDNIALICAHQQPNHLDRVVRESTTKQEDCLTWTYRQLMVASKDVSLAFSSWGVKRGDSIVVFLPTCAEWALLFWVAATLELTFIPIARESLWSCCSSQDYPLELLKPSVIVVATAKDAFEFEMLYPDIAGATNIKLVCFEYESYSWKSWLGFECLTEDLPIMDPTRDTPERPGHDDNTLDADRVAVVLFTDGNSETTVKGCPLTVSNLRTAMVNKHGVPSQRHLITTPLSGVIALETAMMAWKSGGVIVMPEERFTVESTLNAIETQACTNMICTPDQAREMMKHPLIHARNLDSLQSLSFPDHGEEALLLDEAREAFNVPWATFLFSISEGFGAIGWHRRARAFDTVYSVGTVLHGSKVKVCNNGRQIRKKNEEGEVHVGGEAIISGYLGGVSPSAFYVDEEGDRWLVTRYLAIVDDDGLIYIIRRKATPGEDQAPTPTEEEDRKVGRQDDEDDEGEADSEIMTVEVNHGSLGMVPVDVVLSPEPAKSINIQRAGTWRITIEQIGRQEWPVNEAGEVDGARLSEEVVALLNGVWS